MKSPFFFQYGYKIKNTDNNKNAGKPIDNSAEISNEMLSIIEHGNRAEFEVLRTKYGITDINKPVPKQMWNPLMYACRDRNVDLVDYLLNALHADPNGCSNETPLILVCQGILAHDQYGEYSADTEEKVLAIAGALIGRGAIINMSNGYGETAFMFAANNGFAKVLDMLLQNNVSIEACDNNKRTAIFYAVEANRCDIVKQLIDAGAMIDVTDRFQDTPARIAASLCFEDIESLLTNDEIILSVPVDYSSYNTYQDLIPTAFPPKMYVPH